MSFGQTLFGFSGRLNRLAFFGYCLILAVLLGVVAGAILFLLMRDGNLTPELNAVLRGLTVLSLWPGAALIVKRLHDMDRTGLHAIWIVALSVASAVSQELERVGPNALPLTLQIMSLLVGLWLLFASGTAGANRFGLPRQQLRSGGAYA